MIKKVTLADIDKLIAISKETFTDTFAKYNSKEELDKYIEDNLNYSILSSELKNDDSSFYFIYLDQEIAGYLKLNVNQAQTEDVTNNAMEVQRIYIRVCYKRNGLGKDLINYAEQEALKLNKDFLWLGVWEHNQTALSFYNKFGFKTVSEHKFIIGNDIQKDLIMTKSINKEN